MRYSTPGTRAIALLAACMWGGYSAAAGAPGHDSPTGRDVTLATGPIIDLDFSNISGSIVPDGSGNGNDGAGKKGDIGSETSWNPGTVTDSRGNAAVLIDGTQKERMEIPNRSGSLDVNPYSILVQFTLDGSVDTDPLHQRYELMEKAGGFWFNIREDTNPKYLLRVGGYFNGTAHALTGLRPVPDKTLTWAIGTYDGAQLKTYLANGDGTNLVLDNSIAQTGTVATGSTITGIDENLVVGAKHRKGHFVDGSGGEILEGMFNGTMSRFIVYDTALTQAEIAAVISGSGPAGKPGPVQVHFIQKTVVSSGANATVPIQVTWSKGTCAAGSTYNVTARSSGNPTVVRSVTALNARIDLVINAPYTISIDCNGGSSTTANVSLTGYQESAASYTGTWQTANLAAAWRSAAKYTSANSASASFHCTSCRAVAWVTDEDSAHGSARVYVDGVLKGTVNTQSTSPLNRVIAYTFDWATAAPHTLKIVNVATSGHPRITIDGFAIRR
jgi:hypothetical protein